MPTFNLSEGLQAAKEERVLIKKTTGHGPHLILREDHPVDELKCPVPLPRDRRILDEQLYLDDEKSASASRLTASS